MDEASVTVIVDGTPRSVAFTGALALRLDERQYEAGRGPCLDADAATEVAGLRTALPSRAVIEQAKGILMRDQRCAEEEAFGMLVQR